jgi:hypothetical protein
MSATRIDYSIRPAFTTRSGASPCIGFLFASALATRSGAALRIPALATRSGALPRIDFSFAPALATRSGAALRIPALATRSGASPRIGIYSPGVGNTLGGCALQPDASNARGLHLTLLALAAFYIIDDALSATSTLVRHILARVRHGLQQAFDNDIAYSKHSKTSSP